MKSVMQAIWMTTSAIGSLIVILVVEGDFFDRQVRHIQRNLTCN